MEHFNQNLFTDFRDDVSQSGSSTTSSNKAKRKRVKLQENAVLRSDFSFSNLYKSSIPTGLTVEQTGERLAEELGDRDPVNLCRLFI
jgi:hypothetical protein